MLKKVIAFFCALAVSLGVGSVGFAAVDYSGIIESETAWVAELQQPSGAIVMTRDKLYGWQGKDYYKIEPYFANLAAIGMLAHPTPDHLAAAKRWMTWYMEHLNRPDYNGVNGTVYVHYADPATGNEVSGGDYDSSDAYAATFLTLVKTYVEAGGDRAFVLAHKERLETIAGAMLATMEPDGLTFAKPNYPIKFLMDNAEVYEGLASIEWLEREVFRDERKAREYAEMKRQNAGGVESLWSEERGSYDKYQGGPTDWNVFYADAAAQVFPAWNGLIPADGPRFAHLYGQLNAHFPGWPTLNKPDAFPWAILAYAAALKGDQERVDTFLDTVKRTYIDPGHKWVWYNMEAGFSARAAKAMRDRANLALGAKAKTSDRRSEADRLTDGKLFGGWTSSATKKGERWAEIDLGETKTFDRIVIKWDSGFAPDYRVQTADRGNRYTDAIVIRNGNGGTDDLTFSPVSSRYVRVLLPEGGSPVGIREIEIYRTR